MRNKRRLGVVLLLSVFFAITAIACSKKETQAKEVRLSECKIIYDQSDYMSKRYAYRLFTQIRVLTGKSLETIPAGESIDGATITVEENKALDKGTGKIEVKDNTIACQVNSYYGFEVILDYLTATHKIGRAHV